MRGQATKNGVVANERTPRWASATSLERDARLVGGLDPAHPPR